MNKLIGYQIVSNDGKNEMPDNHLSFEVITDISKLVLWLKNEKKKSGNSKFRWVLPIFEGDIEEPIFIDYIY